MLSSKWKCLILKEAKKSEFVPLTNDVFIDLTHEKELERCCESLFDAIPSQCCDQRAKEFLKQQIVPKCSLITVEYPYYESDYLSTFYLYHVRKFQPVGKACCRLILYDLQGKYAGYISLRPITADRKIGRAYLSPQVFAPSNYGDIQRKIKNRDFYVICGNFKIHVGGEEGYVKAMPYMQQEGDVAVCAHVALWSVLRFFSSRFHNSRDYTMGEIVSLVPSPQVRKIPSRGLTVDQISTVLTETGFSTIIIRRDARHHDDFFSEVITYIDSGIPVIAFSRELSHAVVLCGRVNNNKDIFDEANTDSGNKESRETRLSLLAEKNQAMLGNGASKKLLFDASLIDCILVNDDNKFPYFAIPAFPQGESSQGGLTSFSQVDFCIVPLYKRMQLSYFDAKNIVTLLCNNPQYLWNSNPVREADGEYLMVRMNIASSNTVKEFVKDSLEKKCIPEELNNLLNIPYSRFLWVAQVSTFEYYKEGYCNGFILLDSTCSVTDPNVCLALADQRQCEFIVAEPVAASFKIDYGEASIGKFRLPLFDRNFERVRR